MLKVSASQLSTWRQCHRKWGLRQVAGVVSVKNPHKTIEFESATTNTINKKNDRAPAQSVRCTVEGGINWSL